MQAVTSRRGHATDRQSRHTIPPLTTSPDLSCSETSAITQKGDEEDGKERKRDERGRGDNSALL